MTSAPGDGRRRRPMRQRHPRRLENSPHACFFTDPTYPRTYTSSSYAPRDRTASPPHVELRRGRWAAGSPSAPRRQVREYSRFDLVTGNFQEHRHLQQRPPPGVEQAALRHHGLGLGLGHRRAGDGLLHAMRLSYAYPAGGVTPISRSSSRRWLGDGYVGAKGRPPLLRSEPPPRSPCGRSVVQATRKPEGVFSIAFADDRWNRVRCGRVGCKSN